MGFEPTRAETNGLTVHRFNHSAILSIKGVTKLSLAIQNIALLVTSSPDILFLSKFSKKVVAEVFKISVFSEILSRIAEFKLQIAIHYNIEPIKKTTKMGFEPTQAETNGLTVHRLNHLAILSIKGATKLSLCM